MRILYIIVGIAAFVLGTIGTVLPVLPTVPFYLLATWCFARSSKRLHDWLNSKPLYRKHMTPFFNGEGLTLRQKVTMMSVTTILMLIAFVLMGEVLIGRIVLGGGMALPCVLFHLPHQDADGSGINRAFSKALFSLCGKRAIMEPVMECVYLSYLIWMVRCMICMRLLRRRSVSV